MVAKKQELKEIEGTSYYMAPEVINKRYTSQCDLWSVGVLMFTMLSGKPPFDGNTDTEIMENVKLAEYNLNGIQWEGVSEEAKILLKQLLQKDPHKRATAKSALKNTWFQIVEVKAVDEKLIKQCLKNILNFNASQKIQQAVLNMMVEQLVSKKEQGKLRTVFKVLDLNKDGII